jgi:HSP20 family molecular chaperone IbpA
MAGDDRRQQAYRITQTIIRSGEGGVRLSGWRPNVDLYETEASIVVTVDLAGVDPDSIDISVSGRRLIVTGSRAPVVRARARRIHHLEIPYGPFQLAVDLPGSVDATNSEADWTNGLLEVTLPFPQAIRPVIGPRERGESV